MSISSQHYYRGPNSPFTCAYSIEAEKFRNFDFLDEIERIKQGKETAWEARRRLVAQFAWAIPNAEAIDTLVAFSRECGNGLLEVGAGTGYWAWKIHNRGGTILATDHHRPTKGENEFGHNARYIDITKVDAVQAVRAWPDRLLFMCWPPFDTPMAKDALRAYQGPSFAIVGEPAGGCTGCGEFWNDVESEWKLRKEVEIPQWEGIHDALFIFDRLDIDTSKLNLEAGDMEEFKL